jgi:hypothetical protein
MTAAVALGSVAPERSGSAPGSAGSVAARAAMLDVLARAASPAERIAGGWLRPSGEPAVAELRLARWSQRIADGRPDRIAEIPPNTVSRLASGSLAWVMSPPSRENRCHNGRGTH